MCITQPYSFNSVVIAVVAIFGGHFLIKCVMCCMRRKAEKELKREIKELKEKYDDNGTKEKIQGEHKRLTKLLLDKKDELRNLFPTDYEEEMAKWMGIFERTMYIGAWLMGYREFIGAWLVVKIVGNWPDRASGRVDRFLIGAGLSVSIAVIASLLI